MGNRFALLGQARIQNFSRNAFSLSHTHTPSASTDLLADLLCEMVCPIMHSGCNGRACGEGKVNEQVKGGVERSNQRHLRLKPSESTDGQKGVSHSSRNRVNPFVQNFGFCWFTRYTF